MRTVILLLLFVSGFAYAQPDINDPSPYELCEIYPGMSFATFDLSSKDVEISNGLPNLTITYHHTLADAQTGANPLPDIYSNVTSPQTIYVRAVDNGDATFSTTTLDLVINPTPIANQPTNLVQIDTPFDGVAAFDLTINANMILGGQTSMTVTYFTSLANAQTNAAPIMTPTSFINSSNPQTIHVRVENATGCFNTTSFQLIVSSPGDVIIPDPNFRLKLITLGVDTNADSNIQIAEAEAVTADLDVSNANISDLTGFEAFVNVPKLRCISNNLTSLTINNMPNLKIIDCGFNFNLASLNLSNLPVIDSLSTYNTNLSSLVVNSLTSLKKLDFSFNHISSIDVSTLTNLRILNGNSNWLTALNVSTLTNLEELEFGSNQLTTIDVSPLVNLKRLNCSNNNINTLNPGNLPNLEYLDCSNNQADSLALTGLPNLKHLSCGGNDLTALNASILPSLEYLDCSANDLTSINVNGLTNLEYFSFALNQMPNINIAGLTALTYFNGSSNLLTNVSISGFPNLTSVYLTNNLLTNLTLSNLNSLSLLYCDYNQLTGLDITGLSNLSLFYCNNNLLTSLTLTGAVELEWMDCHQNQLTAIDFTGLTTLATVLCDNNLLTSLDFSTNPIFSNLSCTFNNLVDINIKNGYPNINTNNFWHDNPSLVFVCADEEELGQVQQILTQSSLGTVSFNTYCSFVPGGNYNTITGNITFDANNNGCDTNDITQPNIRVNITDGTTTGATFINADGNYSFYTQAGNFTITPAIENPSWFNFSPASAMLSFTDNNSNISTQNFCLSANGNHPDLEIVISPITPARPGFDATYRIVYRNKGNTMVSGNANFTFDDTKIDYVSATSVPNTVATGSLTWNYTNLAPFESRSFVITLNINSPVESPAVNIDDVLAFTATINPIAGDENQDDNTFNYNQIVVGAFDPNDITCIEGSAVSPSEIGNYLHYVVNFENTGNYYAENVVVKDVIDTTKYDISSLQLQSTSHAAYTRIVGNTVEFIFENINLTPRAGTPPVGGHGDVLFKIRSNNNLVVGDFVSKSAKIYFDYNAPIVTNDAETTFAALSNPDHQLDSSIKIYPNPTSSIINIECNSIINSIELYDIQGRLLQIDLADSNTIFFDVSNRQKGLYFLKINTDNGSKVEKLVKE